MSGRIALPGLETGWLGRECLLLEEVDSTNTYLKDRAGTLPHGTVVVARRQTGGKGRLGKTWDDKKGQSLSFSLLLREGATLADMARLPLLTGLAVREALAALCGSEDFAIKWSNDVLHRDKKVCGILCESRIAFGGERPFAVVGIGVNLTQTREEFTRLGLVYADSLFLVTAKIFDALTVAAAVVNRLEPVLEAGFDAVRQDYKRHCVTLGRRVRVQSGGRELEADALDIADDGGLLCALDTGERVVISAGEASVRGLYGYV